MNGSSRKHTRSAKTVEDDITKNASEGVSQAKVGKRRISNGQSGQVKAKRKIVFNETDKVSRNNNSNKTAKVALVDVKSKRKANERKLLDPCFCNVWAREMANEGLKRTELHKPERVLKSNKRSKAKSGNHSNDLEQNWKCPKQKINNDLTSCLQEKSGFSTDLNKTRDGIELSVEADELDYVGDVEQGSDFETEPLDDEFQNQLEEQQQQQPQSRDKSSVCKEKKGDGAETGRLNISDQQLARMSDDKLLNCHPRVTNFFEQFWQKKMKEMKDQSVMGEQVRVTKEQVKLVTNSHNSPLIKSPSDTTIYAPALTRFNGGNREIGLVDLEQTNKLTENDKVTSLQPKVMADPLYTNQPQPQAMNEIISDFVDNMRLEQERRDEMEHVQRAEVRRASTSQNGNPELEKAQLRGDNAILEAEKFKAVIAEPGRHSPDPLITQRNSGDCNNEFGMIPNIGQGVSDDFFFHLTCHIHPNLIHKIERGEFVELEKLLPKDKFHKSDDRLEWVQRDGSTFLVPATKDEKISSLKGYFIRECVEGS